MSAITNDFVKKLESDISDIIDSQESWDENRYGERHFYTDCSSAAAKIIKHLQELELIPT